MSPAVTSSAYTHAACRHTHSQRFAWLSWGPASEQQERKINKTRAHSCAVPAVYTFKSLYQRITIIIRPFLAVCGKCTCLRTGREGP